VFGRVSHTAAVATACAVVALLAATSATAAPAAHTAKGDWAGQADQVCSYWLAKVKKAFGTPVTTAQLYSFAVKVKGMESDELAELDQIPGRTSTGAAALTSIKVDIAELQSSITAWDKGDPALFASILKKYLNDNRPKSAFLLAGSKDCG
jgi:hypothetical protein